MANVASWKIKGLYNADAQKVYEEIGSDGITPKELLERAKNESTELHKCFEWDDSVAGEKYRLIQAQTIIRTLVVEVKEEQEEEPTSYRLFQSSSKVNEYQPASFFVKHEDEYALLLKKAKSELEAFKNRYKHLAELEQVILAIDELI